MLYFTHPSARGLIYVCNITIIKEGLAENGEGGLQNKVQRIFKKGNSHTTVY